MRHDDIDQDMRNLAFDLFYWFSRFEFVLTTAGWNVKPGRPQLGARKWLLNGKEGSMEIAATRSISAILPFNR